MKQRSRSAALAAMLLLTASCTTATPQAEDTSTSTSATDSGGSARTGPSTVVSSVETTAAPSPLRLDPTVIILDASGSMITDDAPGPRIDAAKNAVLSLVGDLPDGAPIGLIVYGTGTDSSDGAKTSGCQDITTLIPLGPADKPAIVAAVGGITASGYTPIGSALRSAVATLPASGPRNIVLVSDGEDTCAPPDPCVVAKEISGAAVGLAVHTVGFRVSGSAKDQLSCIAREGGGSYVDAANAAQLQARLRNATDPNASMNTFTSTGFSGLSIGMTIAQAQTADPSISAGATGTVTVVWRDCDLTFTDGTLVAIVPHSPIPTQDGLAVGDDVSKAGQLYGSTALQTDGGRTHAIFSATAGGDVGYDVVFTPNATAGALSGPVGAISICRCKPAQTAATAVDANGYLKTPGRWWFRTPDDGWNCSIATRLFCETRARSGNPEATYPPPIGPDYKAPDATSATGSWGGMAQVTNGQASYGFTDVAGDGSEFVYDRDKGTPGLGKILGDGQVLAAGGYRCSVKGFTVTCTDPSTGVGFAIGQDAYKIYPRDGAAPDPFNQASSQPAVTPTAVVNVAAADADGQPMPGYTIIDDQSDSPVDCSYPSPNPSAVGVNTHNCSPHAASAHFCWGTTGTTNLACSWDARSKDLHKYSSEDPLTDTPAATDPIPWALDLVNGSKCDVRLGGAFSGRPDDYTAVYVCDNETTFVLGNTTDPLIDKSGPQWVVKIGELSDTATTMPAPTPVGVATAYFAATG